MKQATLHLITIISLLSLLTTSVHAQEANPSSLEQKEARMKELICQPTEIVGMRELAQTQLQSAEAFATSLERKRARLVTSLQANAATLGAKALEEQASLTALELERLDAEEIELTKRIETLEVYIVRATHLGDEHYHACMRGQSFDGVEKLPDLGDLPKLPDGATAKPLSEEDKARGKKLLDELGIPLKNRETESKATPQQDSMAPETAVKERVEVAASADNSECD